jgi:broad specificity phosphatase PhoE
LGETAWIKDSSPPFWRIYSSDLSRAEKTTRLILEGARGAPVLGQEKRRRGLNNGDNDIGNQIIPRLVRLDARLRELSKGVKQGLPKSLSFKEAHEWHARHSPKEEIPLLETDDDGWNRMRAFVNEVIRDAVIDAKELRQQNDEQECNTNRNNDEPSSARHTVTTAETTAITTTTSIIKKADHPPVYKVLIISHSALLRIFLRRLLSDERLKRHPDARFDTDGHVYLPNTSLTILEIRVRGVASSSRSQCDDDDDDEDKDDGEDSLSPTIRVDPIEESAENLSIVQLTWAGHLVRMSEPEMQFANGE